MKKGSGTQSSLLWEVERLLDECKQDSNLPQILLMENVPQVLETNNIKDFQEWQLKLESLGYSNYTSLLNAKDYGIPQNRNRCFMVSILGKYNYTFPQKIKLNLKLKDLLENDVDEKYYLTEKEIDFISDYKFKKRKVNIEKIKEFECFDFRYDEGIRTRIEKDICPTINTLYGTRKISSQVLIKIKTKNGKIKVRTITPLETWKFMGFDIDDYKKAKFVNNDTQLCKQAGNSIVVDVLYYIFKQFYD